MCTAVSKTAAEVPPGSACIGKPFPLLALSIIADAKNPNSAFALIFSVSHVIVDGFSYYQLLSMLSKGGVARPLSARRKHEINAESKVAMGAAEHAFAHGGASSPSNLIFTPYLHTASSHRTFTPYLTLYLHTLPSHRTFTAGAMLFNILSGIICGKTPTIETYHVDLSRVAEEKAVETARAKVVRPGRFQSPALQPAVG